MRGYDVVVVGGGSAGCALAARLSRTRSVCLVEAGPGAGGADLCDARVIPARVGHPATWSYPARLTPSRTTRVVRGRVLGGSSAVNGGYFVRATTADLQRLAAAAGPSWSVEALTKAYARAESDTDMVGPGHGATGPMPVARTPAARYHQVSTWFTRAALAAGHPAQPDMNAPGAHGVGPVPLNIRGRERVSTAQAYLRLAGRLDVRASSVVTRLRLARGRATGVLLADGSRVDADEVVLSAGALATPSLLAASDLGPRLITGVSDHPELALHYTPTALLDEERRAGLEVALQTPDDLLELRPYTASFAALVPGSGAPDVPALGVALMAPVGRGTLSVGERTELDLDYLRDEPDRAAVRAGVRLAHGLLRGFSTATEVDDVVAGPDAALDRWIADRVGTSLHTCGSVPLGASPDAPVDERFRVRGIDGLRVVDASVLPVVPRRGPHATVVMLAEHAATLF